MAGYFGYPDLDLVNVLKERIEILTNEEIGWRPEQRAEEFKRARRIANILNGVGVITGIWLFFWPRPYDYAVLAAIVIPISCFVAMRFTGLIRIDSHKGSAYPSVIWAFISTSIPLALRAMLDYNIFDHRNVWLISAVILPGFMMLAYINKDYRLVKWSDSLILISLAMIMFAYSYGLVVELNCMYDRSMPKIFTARIKNKSVDSGQITIYHFELTPWSSQENSEEVTVSEELYDKMKVGDEVKIIFKEGDFEIPWFMVTQ